MFKTGESVFISDCQPIKVFLLHLIITVFLTESHILEDVNKCVLALQEGDADCLDRTAGAIRGRCARISNVVTAEMDNYHRGLYTDRVMEAVSTLRDQSMCYVKTDLLGYASFAHAQTAKYDCANRG